MIKPFIAGAFAGAITGIPIGPVNIAVIDTAYRHHVKRALSVALGGAVADLLYALLGVLWFGPLVETRPYLPPILYALSCIPLVIYGITILRSKPGKRSEVSADGKVSESYFWGGLGLGMALILLNPSTLLLWVVIVGSSTAGQDQASSVAVALGIGFGSLIWFSFVAWLAHKGKNFLDKKGGLINQIVGLLLIGLGFVSLGRAVLYWLKM